MHTQYSHLCVISTETYMYMHTQYCHPCVIATERCKLTHSVLPSSHVWHVSLVTQYTELLPLSYSTHSISMVALQSTSLLYMHQRPYILSMSDYSEAHTATNTYMYMCAYRLMANTHCMCICVYVCVLVDESIFYLWGGGSQRRRLV